MATDRPPFSEVERVMQEYLRAVEDVANMDVSDVIRVARILEIEARFLAAMAACRSRVEPRREPDDEQD